MTRLEEQEEPLSPEAAKYVALFEAGLNRGADLEELMARATAMQEKFANAGNDDAVAALADAMSILEQRHGVDSVAVAGEAAANGLAAEGDGRGIFNPTTIQGIIYRQKRKEHVEQERPRVEDIIQEVARIYGLSVDELKNGKPQDEASETTEARKVAIYIITHTTHVSGKEVLIFFAGINQPFVTASNQAIKSRLYDPEISAVIEQIMEKLGLEEKGRNRSSVTP